MKHSLIGTVAALALGLGLAGCGGDDGPEIIKATATTTPTASPTTSAPTTDPTDEPTDDPSKGDPDDIVAALGPAVDDRPLTGEVLKRATEAALKVTGGGRVEEAEESDDLDHRFEVEIEYANGEDVTVELDENFKLVRIDD